MENNKVLLSIIIPTYNAEDTIRQAVDSLLNQSLRDVEVICVDDGSKDGTVRILEEYTQKDPRFRFFQQEHKYAGNARNIGIDESRGEYLYFMDADDYVLDYALEAAYNKCKYHDLDCLKFCSLTYDMKAKKYVAYGTNDFSSLITGDYDRLLNLDENSPLLRISVAPWSGMYRRQFVVSRNCRFNGLRCVNDRSFFTKIITNHPRIMCSSDRVVVHRINQDGSLVGTKADHFDCQINSLLLTEKQLREDNVPADIAEFVMRHEYRDTAHWYRRYAVDPERRANMERQINEYINSKEADYSIILQDLIKHVNAVGTVQAELVERKPFHEECPLPKVSVVVPVGNDEEHLNSTMESLTSQTMEEMEFIIVNNGATDQAMTIAKEYAAVDRRFRLEEQPANGYGSAVNKGIDRARGAYIGIVRAGDMMKTEMFKRLYKEARTSRADLVRADYSRFYIRTDGTMKKKAVRMSSDEFMYDRILKPGKDKAVFSSPFSIWSGIYRKAFLDNERIRFNETSGNAYQESGFWFLSLSKAKRIRFCQDTLYYQRQNLPETAEATLRDADAMVQEYQWLRQELEKAPELLKRQEKIYNNRKLASLLLIWSRLGDTDQQTFLPQIREELRDAYENDLFEKAFARKTEMDLLAQIIKDPESVSRQTNITVFVTVKDNVQNVLDCLKTIYFQTRARIDTVCINCGPEDEASRILEQAAKNNERIRVVGKNDRCLSAVINEEITRVRGEYILVADPDLLFETGMLDQAWNKAQKDRPDVLCLCEYKDPEKSEEQDALWIIDKDYLPGKQPFSGTDVDVYLYQLFTNDLSNKLFRTAFIRDKGLMLTSEDGQKDIPFVFTALACAERIAIVNKCPVLNPREPDRGPKDEERNGIQLFHSAVQQLRDNLKERGIYGQFERNVINYTVHYGAEQMARGTDISAFEEAYNSLLKGWLREMGAFDRPRAYYYDAEDYETAQDIARMSATAFLLKRYNQRQEKVIEEKLVPMENKAITGSVSFRLGRMITWGPRRLRDRIRLIRGHRVSN